MQVTIIRRWLDKRRSEQERPDQERPEPAESPHLIGENVYGRYAVPRTSAHRRAAQRILEGKIYEPDTIELIRRECGDGDVVHAGTFFGDFLPGLSSALAPGARIYAFEPNPENYECARRTLELNQIDNVVLEWLGLGAEPGKSELLTVNAEGVPRGGSSRFLHDGEEPSGQTVTVDVPIDSIDSRVPADRTLSVLQLDVEGHEQAALEGALATLRRCRPLIVLESVPSEEWVAEHLAPLGYRAVERVHHNTVFRIG